MPKKLKYRLLELEDGFEVKTIGAKLHTIEGNSTETDVKFFKYFFRTLKRTNLSIISKMKHIQIDLDQDIQPLTEFRKHTAEFIDRIKTNKRPIILTQHGKSSAVLVDVAEYQRLCEKADFMAEMEESHLQIQNGEVFSNEETKRMVFEKINEWK